MRQMFYLERPLRVVSSPSLMAEIGQTILKPLRPIPHIIGIFCAQVQTMTDFSDLLRQGANEVRQYMLAIADEQAFLLRLLESLAARMERASTSHGQRDVEHEIDSIARSIIDSGPIDVDISPSFFRALDSLQRKRKREI